MCLTVKRLCCISLPILVIYLVLNFYLPTWAQSTESNTKKVETATSIENKSNTELPSDLSAKEIPTQRNRSFNSTSIFTHWWLDKCEGICRHYVAQTNPMSFTAFCCVIY